jgi:hypothetical protein
VDDDIERRVKMRSRRATGVAESRDEMRNDGDRREKDTKKKTGRDSRTRHKIEE